MNEISRPDFASFVNYEFSDDFSLYEIGKQACESGYSYGPVVRTRCILHYVFSGKGILRINQKEYTISAHQAFIIPANVLAFYQADEKEPWTYEWIHVDGPKLSQFLQESGLSENNPVFKAGDDYEIIEQIMKDLVAYHEKQYFCIGKIYELFDYIVSHSTIEKNRKDISKKLIYVKKIINYVQLKYCESIQVEDIAHACGFDRSYLSKVFKEATGQTLQQYILSYRMKKACELLTQHNHSIQFIAYSVGYGDVFTFSKAFKKLIGLSPSEYRKIHQTS